MERTPGRERGIGTIKTLVVFSLFGFALMGIVGLHMVAVSTGTAAGTSSIAGHDLGLAGHVVERAAVSV